MNDFFIPSTHLVLPNVPNFANPKLKVTIIKNMILWRFFSDLHQDYILYLPFSYWDQAHKNAKCSILVGKATDIWQSQVC